MATNKLYLRLQAAYVRFIALRRGCSESKLAFPGFGTALLLLRSDFSSDPAEFSQAASDHSSCRNILLSEQKLFGKVITCLGPYIALSRCGAHGRTCAEFW